MGKNMRSKLRSGKGASITFALLAFLACAVVSAVLLAAASVASGRIGGLAASDRRYYAVASAAQLFCDSLKDPEEPDKALEITVERRHEERFTTVTKYVAVEGGGFIPVSDPHHGEIFKPYDESYNYDRYSLWMKDSSDPFPKLEQRGYPLREQNLLRILALNYVFGSALKPGTESGEPAGALEDLLERTFDLPPGHGKELDLTMEVSAGEDGDGGEWDFLTVEVRLNMGEDGALKARFTCPGEKNGGYAIEVVLLPVIRDNSQDPVEEERETVTTAPDAESENAYCAFLTTTRKTIKTTTISWAVSEVQKEAGG